ncbi:serine/threonine-protein phosphatase 6 regulatory ankyrin repeat subunit A-like [Coregonus clupeaformis]|uniref:serine/threonine-protein phosphatase 6 regulatory ankyrin repeat subunit A-like n=1 Tax=Coregonus clupeaformis TaxID=59861 RepID=UPI001E1C2578|nr:serine/threonine-protein phosphatase 6 regulatory ankyrin repeat subunit A-like [Coregonus clupeaformis]
MAITLLCSSLQDNEKRTLLHAAAYLGDAEILELLILSGARVNAKDNKWLTPLHRAVASCSEEAVQVLLKHSTDVNARDKNWQTPLHIAAANKAVRCAEALVPLLSNVNVSDRAGRTALHHSAFSGHQESDEPTTYGKFKTKLRSYESTEKFSAISTDDNVMKATTNGHSECLRLLIGNADLQSAVDVQDGNGQ